MTAALLTMIAAGVCFGDADGDMRITGRDFLGFQAAFNTRLGDEEYDVRYDFDASGDIGGSDFLILQRIFNRPCHHIVARSPSSEWASVCANVHIEWERGAKITAWPADSCIHVPRLGSSKIVCGLTSTPLEWAESGTTCP